MEAGSKDAEIARETKERLARAAELANPVESLKERCRAHERLVTAAFIEGRAELQPLFHELFPPPEDVGELRQTPLDPGHSFADLESPNVQARRRAAEFFEQRGRAELGMLSGLLLRDPRTVTRLLRAASDADAQVQETAIVALGRVVGRLKYRSPEVLEALLSLHRNARSAAVRRAIAIAILPFEDARKWPAIVDALSERRLNEVARRRLVVALGGKGASMPRDIAERIAARLLALLKAEKSPDLRADLVTIIGEVGDPTAAAELRSASLEGVRPEVLQDALDAIERRQAAPRV